MGWGMYSDSRDRVANLGHLNTTGLGKLYARGVGNTKQMPMSVSHYLWFGVVDCGLNPLNYFQPRADFETAVLANAKKHIVVRYFRSRHELCLFLRLKEGQLSDRFGSVPRLGNYICFVEIYLFYFVGNDTTS